jgi:Fic family protein
MAVYSSIKDRLQKLKESFDKLRQDKESLINLIDEAELPENVYNSNAIENSTLTLKETEKILLEMEVSKSISVREVFETKNLARVINYKKNKFQTEELSVKLILLLHQMLIGGIDDNIAGRFRQGNEYVRIGTTIGIPPEHIDNRIKDLLIEYSSNLSSYFLEKIAKFHLEFEIIHPFIDGNGRIGRTLINYQLLRLGFPRIIIRDKDKKRYYDAFLVYRDDKKTKKMEIIIALALMESLHKRIVYLKGETIITLADSIKKQNASASSIINAASRQTIPAFREKGVWKISENYIFSK